MNLEKSQSKIILHIDMNSYFASVEQQANPFLRGRSVGVCAYLSDNGTIIASSIEAKQKGIKTGTKVREAKLLDPDIILLENEPAKYRSTTDKIFKILSDYTNVVEPYSIDEAFLDMTGFVKNWDDALKKADDIKERIRIEVGEWLYASVGLSWTKFLAKFAGDIAPKKSVLMIKDQKELANILVGRDLKDAWGINVRTEERLKFIGINDLGELKNFDENKIRRFLGRWGYYLWCNVNGIEINKVAEGREAAKSIGHSYVLQKQSSDKEYLKSVFYKLCEKTGRRLREGGQEAGGISINLSYLNYGGVHKSFKTNEKMFTTDEIFSEVEKFLDKLYLMEKVRGLAVSVTRLSSVSGQLNLFENNLSKKELSRSLDKINSKYGEYTVISGRMFGMDDVARDRIGFRKVI